MGGNAKDGFRLISEVADNELVPPRGERVPCPAGDSTGDPCPLTDAPGTGLSYFLNNKFKDFSSFFQGILVKSKGILYQFYTSTFSTNIFIDA